MFFAFSTITAKSRAEQRVTLVFGANMPIITNKSGGGFPSLASIVSSEKRKLEETFFLFGGGSIGPSPMASFDRGIHIIDILNGMEPDFMGVHSGEFTYSSDELSLRAMEAVFPIIVSNIYDPLTGGNVSGLSRYALVKKGNISVGFMSLVHPQITSEVEIDRLQVDTSLEKVNALAMELKQQGADLVILHFTTLTGLVSKLIDSSAVDIAMSSYINDSFSATDGEASEKYIQLKQHGEIAIVDVEINPVESAKPLIRYQVKTVPLARFPPREDIAIKVMHYYQKLDKLLSKELFSLDVKLDTRIQTVRKKESNFGSLLADALRYSSDADIGLINGGAIRGNKLYKVRESLSLKSLAMELPFRNKMIIINVSGADILSALENGLSHYENNRGRFLHVSGLQVTFKPSRPVNQRVISVLIDGQPIDVNKMYKVATTDFIANGNDGFTMFDSTKHKMNIYGAPLIKDVFVDYIQNAPHKYASLLKGKRLIILEN